MNEFIFTAKRYFSQLCVFLYILFLVIVLVFVATRSSGASNLTTWKEYEHSKISKGRIIPNKSSLLMDYKFFRPLDIDEDKRPFFTSIKKSHQVVAKNSAPINPLHPRILNGYEAEKVNSLLIDSQRLLSTTQAKNFVNFLKHHAEISQIAIRVYLFSEHQQPILTNELKANIREIHKYEPLTAILYCYLHKPENNELVFAGKGADSIHEQKTKKILINARLKALQKSEPISQIKSFLIELSIKLFWLEKEIFHVNTILSEASSHADVASAVFVSPMAQARHYFLSLLIIIALILIALLIFIIAYRTWKRKHISRLPIWNIPERLGAKHAAGIGALISFDKKHGSPLQQKNKEFDFLSDR